MITCHASRNDWCPLLYLSTTPFRFLPYSVQSTMVFTFLPKPCTTPEELVRGFQEPTWPSTHGIWHSGDSIRTSRPTHRVMDRPTLLSWTRTAGGLTSTFAIWWTSAQTWCAMLAGPFTILGVRLLLLTPAAGLILKPFALEVLKRKCLVSQASKDVKSGLTWSSNLPVFTLGVDVIYIIIVFTIVFIFIIGAIGISLFIR